MINIEQLDTKSIKPYSNNNKLHDDKQIELLAKQIKEHGFDVPIVVDKDLTIIKGHGRLLAAKKLKLKQVPCIIRSDLNQNQIQAARIADNKLSESPWDTTNLLKELDELRLEDFDPQLVGFDSWDISTEGKNEVKEGLTDPDDVPEVKETSVVLGDIYQLSNHRLMCGDSTNKEQVELLMNGKKAEMVFTDPPYGYSYQSNHQTKHKQLLNDDIILDFLPNALNFTKDNVPFYICASHQTSNIWKALIEKNLTYKNQIIWKKNNWSMGDLTGAYACQYEIIFFAHKGRVELLGERSRDIWEFDREPPKDHPTQKPINLIKFALTKHNAVLILDLFLGSGSTLIACEQTNRTCYGMELDPYYCQVIIDRWEKFTGQKAIKL